MPKERLATRIERGVVELENLIRERCPAAEFRRLPRRPGRREVVVEVYADLEDQTDLSDIISDRAVDLVIDTKTVFIFLLEPFDKRPSLKQPKTA